MTVRLARGTQSRVAILRFDGAEPFEREHAVALRTRALLEDFRSPPRSVRSGAAHLSPIGSAAPAEEPVSAQAIAVEAAAVAAPPRASVGWVQPRTWSASSASGGGMPMGEVTTFVPSLVRLPNANWTLSLGLQGTFANASNLPWMTAGAAATAALSYRERLGARLSVGMILPVGASTAEVLSEGVAAALLAGVGFSHDRFWVGAGAEAQHLWLRSGVDHPVVTSLGGRVQIEGRLRTGKWAGVVALVGNYHPMLADEEPLLLPLLTVSAQVGAEFDVSAL